MGRYFNDDMTEDQNDDYDAYLEHYGIPKEKWDATVRARFDQLHHKTKDAYKSISDGAKKFGSKASKQITGAEHNVEQAAKTVKKGVKKIKKTGKNIKKEFDKKTTYTHLGGRKVRGIYTRSGFLTIDIPKKKKGYPYE